MRFQIFLFFGKFENFQTREFAAKSRNMSQNLEKTNKVRDFLRIFKNLRDFAINLKFPVGKVRFSNLFSPKILKI